MRSVPNQQVRPTWPRKLLEDASIKPDSVISDVLGKSAREMPDATVLRSALREAAWARGAHEGYLSGRPVHRLRRRSGGRRETQARRGPRAAGVRQREPLADPDPLRVDRRDADLHLVIGTGKRLFADGAVPAGLKLVEHTVSSTGVVIGNYVPA